MSVAVRLRRRAARGVAAQRAIAGDLLRGEQGRLADVRGQVLREGRRLLEADPLRQFREAGLGDCALAEGVVELSLRGDDLRAEPPRLRLVRGAERLGLAALLGRELQRVGQFQDMLRAGPAVQLGWQDANEQAGKLDEDPASRRQPTVSPSDYSPTTR